MSSSAFKTGFLSVFNPFKPAPKRSSDADKNKTNVFDGEFFEIIKAESLMHRAFERALCDANKTNS